MDGHGEGLDPHPRDHRAARQCGARSASSARPARCPREAGARIVLQPDGGFFGTIGGGQLEYAAIAAARAALAAGRGKAEFRDWPLGPNLGQCCGGMVKTLTETFDASDLAAAAAARSSRAGGAFATESRLDDDGRIARTLASADRRAKARERADAVGEDAASASNSAIATPVYLFGAGHVGRARGAGARAAAVRRALDRHAAGSISRSMCRAMSCTIRSDAPARELARAPAATPSSLS